jgi:hypothetical protein
MVAGDTDAVRRGRAGRRRTMSTIITTAEAIPPAPYYVLSDDAFMSDWGEAQGRVNNDHLALLRPCGS